MKVKKNIALIIHSMPLILGILLSFLFWKSNSLLLVVYLLLVAVIVFFGKDRKVESWIFMYGVIAGFIIETIGTHISGYQSFTLPQIWGIPYWLVITWGYGFILMKRIGLIIAFGSPWISKNQGQG